MKEAYLEFVSGSAVLDFEVAACDSSDVKPAFHNLEFPTMLSG